MTLKTALAAEIGGAVTQDLFDSLWFADQLVVTRHQHRRRAAYVWRRHAGAVKFAPCAAE